VLGDWGLACFLRQSEGNERGPWGRVVQAVSLRGGQPELRAGLQQVASTRCWVLRPRDAQNLRRSLERAQCKGHTGLRGDTQATLRSISAQHQHSGERQAVQTPCCRGQPSLSSSRHKGEGDPRHVRRAGVTCCSGVTRWPARGRSWAAPNGTSLKLGVKLQECGQQGAFGDRSVI